jgi:hypothetical protein
MEAGSSAVVFVGAGRAECIQGCVIAGAHMIVAVAA